MRSDFNLGHAATALSLALMAAACSPAEPTAIPTRDDPVLERVTDGPLLTDPDLSGADESGEAVTFDTVRQLPVLPANPAAIDAARAEAIEIAGAAAVPLPPRSAAFALARSGAAAHAGTLGVSSACAAGLTKGAIWAARFPAALPIYPRGAVSDAAGSDAAGCKVRVAEFTTPVAPADVLAFYAALSRRSRAVISHGEDDRGSVLRGKGSGFAFDLRLEGEGAGTRARFAIALR